MEVRRRDNVFTTYSLFILKALVLSFPLIILVTGEGEVCFLPYCIEEGYLINPFFLSHLGR
jgi:hypothetical protein